MTTLNIYEYEGIVGAKSNLESGTFINDINDPNSLGIVVSTSKININQSAIDYIKNNYKKELGSFANTMLTKHDASVVSKYGKSSIAILGFDYHLLTNSSGEVEIGRTCDLSVLDDCNIVTYDKDADYLEFVEYVNSIKDR